MDALYLVLYLHEIRCTFKGKDYALFIFVSPTTHITYGFIRDSGVIWCLINWLDFFPESFYITSVTFLHGSGFSHQFIWYQLMSAYQIDHKLLFLSQMHSTRLPPFLGVQKKESYSFTGIRERKEKEGEKKLLTNFS